MEKTSRAPLETVCAITWNTNTRDRASQTGKQKGSGWRAPAPCPQQNHAPTSTQPPHARELEMAAHTPPGPTQTE